MSAGFPFAKAKKLCKLGLALIPTDTATKRPALSWKRFQTEKPTREELAGWFPTNGSNQAAIVTGAVSGVVVVDADSDEALDFVKESLPATPLVVKTARGRHFYYRHPGHSVGNKAHVRTAAGELALDLRADGGYAIAPGSLHPSGVRYEAEGWDETFGPGGPGWDGVPVFDPSWFPAQEAEPLPTGRDEHRPDQADTMARARAWLAKRPPAIQGQGGDDWTIRTVLHVLDFGFSDSEALEALQDWNQTCSPPWTERELMAKLRSARKTHRGGSKEPSIRQGDSRLLDNDMLLPERFFPPLSESASNGGDEWAEPEPFDRPRKPPFPVDEVLVGRLRDYCLAVSELAQTPPEMAFFSMVGVASTCIQKQVKVQSGPSRYLPTNIWAAGVAASGSGKTVVLDEVQRAFSEYEMELRESIEARNAENAQERKQVEADIERLVATKDRTTDQEQELSSLRGQAAELAELPVPDLFVTDPTSESLEDLLASNQGRLGVLNAEAGDYLGILAGRYSKAGGANIKPLLSSYSGETWKTSRVIRGRRHIVNPASTQVLFVQPTVIQDLVSWKDFTQRGFLARFFLMWPDEKPNQKNIWDRAPIPSNLKDSWRSIVRTLAATKAPVDQRGEPDPFLIELTLQARNASYRFWDWVRTETQRNGALGGIRDFGNRLAENVNRLAGVLHVLECLADDKTPWEYCISGETYERAIKVGEWSVSHALQVYAANVSANADNPDAWKVWNVIKGMEHALVVNSRDIYHKLDHNPRFRSASVVKSTLEVLEAMGYVRRFQEPPNKGGGRPKTLYEVNPKALSPLLPEKPVQKVQNPPKAFAEGILGEAKTEAKTPFGPAKTSPGMIPPQETPEFAPEFEEFTL